MLSNLGNLANLIPSNSEGGSNLEEEESVVKNKVLDNNAKMSEYLAENKFDKPELGDSLNEVK